MGEKKIYSLSDPEKDFLLKLARETVSCVVSSGSMLPMKESDSRLTPTLKDGGEAFVTLEKKGRLRGCIGVLDEDMPLYKAVMVSAARSSAGDPRFHPVQPAELHDISIEVSVLSPREIVKDWREVVVGEHGIVVEKHNRRALYLPQVAPDQGWDREEYLSSCCDKAGLPSDAWKAGCRIYVFRAIVFGER